MIETTVESVAVESPPTVAPESSVTEAAEYLRRPEASALPVLKDDAVVGIVTGSDLVALVAETDDRPPVRSIMSTPVTTVSPTATLPEVAERMRTAGFKHLPVVGEGTYRGVLSVRTLSPYLWRSSLDIEWQAEVMRPDSAGSRETAASD